MFATLVTFVLIEVSILKNASNFFELSSLSLILAGCLLGFVILLDILSSRWVRKQEIKKQSSWILILPVVFVISGVVLGSYGYKVTNRTDEKIQGMENRINDLETENKNLDMKISVFLNNKTQPIIIYGK